jgi:hypothetical protein
VGTLHSVPPSRTAPRRESEGSQTCGFEFLLGIWDVRNRRLDDPRPTRVGDSWSEFESRVHAWKILGGAGVADSYAFRSFPGRGESHGFALRLFDSATDVWRIWWAASSPGGRLDPPLVGSFIDGVGAFAGEDELDGQQILVKTRYSEVTLESLRWEQAFSFDRGRSFETNWVMNFRRVA